MRVLVWVFSVATIWIVAMQSPCAQSFTAMTRDQDRSELTIRVQIDPDRAPVHEAMLVKTKSRRPVICSLLFLKATCYQASTVIVDEAKRGMGGPGMDLVFERPISPFAFHLFSGEELYRDADASTAQKMQFNEAGLPASVPEASYLPYLQVYQPGGIGAFWTYEALDGTKDGKNALSFLAQVANTKTTNACVGIEGQNLCGGVFEFHSDSGYSGFAYCAFARIEKVTTTPSKCLALQYNFQGRSFIAAYTSPFIGSGFGAGADGLDCGIFPKAQQTPQAIVDQLIRSFAASKIGVNLRNLERVTNLSPQSNRNNSFLLYGLRAFEPSKILTGYYEYTTATISVALQERHTISLSGTIVLTVNKQNVRDRKTFVEPDDKAVAAYQKVAFEDLEARLTSDFSSSSPAYCQYH